MSMATPAIQSRLVLVKTFPSAGDYMNDNNSCWELFLFVGRSNKHVNPQSAKECFRTALSLAELKHGERSAQTGMCLIELADLLEEIGEEEEAATLTDRYRKILAELAIDLGI